ncbi:MAG: trehalose-6-phosphate synthase, partial [Alphaproteobacteria bacterium]
SGRHLIIGVDRLDYTKGLPERLEAFQRLLQDHPENRSHVSLLQIAPPSRLDVPEYKDIRLRLETTAGHVNGKFAEVDWVPIRYINRYYSRRTLAGLFRTSRIGLVTPLRDGMNLVAKEYVAAQDEKDPGVLLLSRFAGAASQLGDALIVNPHDVAEVAAKLQQGLRMPLAERRQRWSAMMAEVRRSDVKSWRDDFLEALGAVRLAA